MENKNKNKSFFNEIGFKPTIKKLVDHIAKLYLEDENPWVIGYSGGKDSSACLQLMWRVLEKIKSEIKGIEFVVPRNATGGQVTHGFKTGNFTVLLLIVFKYVDAIS